MEVTVNTSDDVDPEDIATALIEAGWYVRSVTVNDDAELLKFLNSEKLPDG